MSNAIDRIAQDISVCEQCPLHQTRNLTVPGEGNPDADVMFIGEGPGRQEDQQGRPFVGASGKRFDQLLSEAGISRQQVYITNVVKCRTPENRNPTPKETTACRHWLQSQIDAIKPVMIITMGNPATQWFQPGTKISDVRGKVTLSDDQHLILPTYHPAAILRTPGLQHSIREDFATIRNWVSVAKPKPAEDTSPPDGPEPSGFTPAILHSLLAAIENIPASTHPPRQQRHSLTTIALALRAIDKAMQQQPDSPYLHWCRNLHARCVAAGQRITQQIPQICRTCRQPYYPPDERDRSQTCPSCQPDPTRSP